MSVKGTALLLLVCCRPWHNIVHFTVRKHKSSWPEENRLSKQNCQKIIVATSAANGRTGLSRRFFYIKLKISSKVTRLKRPLNSARSQSRLQVLPTFQFAKHTPSFW